MGWLQRRHLQHHSPEGVGGERMATSDTRAASDASAPVRAWQREATADPEGFWARAAQQLPWFRTWDRVFEWTPPTFRWFSGAQTNLSYNCLDHHVNAGRGEHTALIAANEQGERREYTYAQLLD